MPLGADGLWVAIRPRAWGDAPRPALFLDRDGVIVEDVGYLSRPEDVRLTRGAGAVIAAANARGIPVVIVTNQSGVGRGFYTWDDFAAVEREVERQLAAAAAYVEGVLACAHHRDAVPPYRADDHPARKPAPGLLLEAAQRLPIDLRRSWIIGDRASDLAAGRNAGLAGGLHVATGYGASHEERAAALGLATDDFAVLTAPSMAAATGLVPLFGEHRVQR